MTHTRRSSLERCAVASGLLTAEQLEEARAALRDPTGGTTTPRIAPSDQEIADQLVAMGRLNAWQAKQLLDGRSKFTLGGYRIVDSIGQGGMGHVYMAEDQMLGRLVAIKVLPREKSTPEAIASFNREIQALASLRHPKLVRAIDAGHDGNVYYMVTEYVPGSDLRKLIRRSGPLTMEDAANIISQVAEGLDHAHQQGLVHRDVKPGNVLVTPEGEAKLSDLGLAGPMYANVEQDPRYGKIVGTADYLSPDHIRSPGNPTPAWDIYSLGCTLYYAVTSKVPFPGGTTSDKARAHCELQPLDPRLLNQQLSDEFVDVLADMMAKDPAQRIHSAAAVVRRLKPWAQEVAEHKRSAASQSATPARCLEPIIPMAPPPVPTVTPPGESGMAAGPVAPPPIVAAVADRPWASAQQPRTPPQPLILASQAVGPYANVLHDTTPFVPSATDTTSDSQDSASLIVATGDPSQLGLLLLLILTPIVLAILAILIAWMIDVML